MKRLPRAVPRRERGAALIIVLAFAVLLTGVTLAYFSRTTSDRQVAHSSFHQSSVDNLAQSAMDIIIGQLRQEIVNGSTATTVNGSTIIYVPATASHVVPQGSGNPDPAQIRNLIRRSVSPDNIVSPGLPSLASAVNSTTHLSANRRSVTPARWNSHYLVPKTNTGNDDSIPIGAFANATPDWVFVTDQGATVIGGPNTSVIGRYAYAVYDEGGLLDVNLAGFPTGTTTVQSGHKGSIGFADLKGLGSTDANRISNPDASGIYQVDRLVGWRNYATTQPTNKFPDSAPAGQAFARNFQTSSVPATNFFNFVVDPTNSFLMVRSNVSTPPGVPVIFNDRTDQMFLSRQQLIAFRKAVGSTTSFSANVLQHLGTFSREQNIPTWLPPSPGSNPVILHRFPVGRFDLFATTPPSNAADIQKYFGLIYVAASGPTAEHWRYVGTSGTTLLSTIPAVSSANQDPDLFPLLQYALPAGTSTSEILSIGASLIDLRDTNNGTTWIEFGSSLPPQKAFGVDVTASTEPGAPPRPAVVRVLNRGFRNVGELGYAYRNGSTALDFYTSGSTDASLLDLFAVSTATPRAAIVNLNTRDNFVLAAILSGAITTEATSATVNTADATTAANSIVGETTNTRALGRAAVTRLASVIANPPFTTDDGTDRATRKTIARALAEVSQVRTWGLFIDVIAQTGRYPPNATSFENGFVVEGEQRYWVHVAIDRFSNQVLDKQIEVVNE
jgi:hypothetical protein